MIKLPVFKVFPPGDESEHQEVVKKSFLLCCGYNRGPTTSLRLPAENPNI